MAKVFIPAQIRELTGDQAELLIEGTTVRDIVAELQRRFPGIEQRLCTGGELAPNLQVSIDDVLSRRGLDARVQPASEVHFLPVFGGG
jgi:molybdopterin synthase sulfur carrier subunit